MNSHDSQSMPLTSPETPPVWSFRLSLVCLVAISASLPMAWISIAKALLFIGGLLYLVTNHVKKQRDSVFAGLWTPPVILAILIFFSLSVLGPDVDLNLPRLHWIEHVR